MATAGFTDCSWLACSLGDRQKMPFFATSLRTILLRWLEWILCAVLRSAALSLRQMPERLRVIRRIRQIREWESSYGLEFDSYKVVFRIFYKTAEVFERKPVGFLAVLVGWKNWICFCQWMRFSGGFIRRVTRFPVLMVLVFCWVFGVLPTAVYAEF